MSAVASRLSEPPLNGGVGFGRLGRRILRAKEAFQFVQKTLPFRRYVLVFDVCQLAQQLFLPLCQVPRRFYKHLHEQIAGSAESAAALQRWHPFAVEPNDLAALR